MLWQTLLIKLEAIANPRGHTMSNCHDRYLQRGLPRH